MKPTGVVNLEREIDRLYELPLDEFTGARNQLARQLKGAEGARVKALEKPTVAAWAVNQLYWRDRRVFDRLMQAAGKWRDAQRALLAGKGRSDFTALQQAQREALAEAIDRGAALVSGAGHPLTGATSQALARTLEALPTDDRPGRLVSALQPAGFEALSGLTLAHREAPPPAAPARHEPGEIRETSGSTKARARRGAGQAREAERAREARRQREASLEDEAAQRRVEAAAAEVARMRRELEAAREAEGGQREAWERARERVDAVGAQLASAVHEEAEARRAMLRQTGRATLR